MAKKDYIVNHGGLMLMVGNKMREMKRGEIIKLEAKDAEKMLERKFLVNPANTEAVEVGSSAEDSKK